MRDFNSFCSAVILCSAQLIWFQTVGERALSEAASVRLVGGINPCSGKVEVLHNGIWRPVCFYDWDLSDGQVVCKELGCGAAKEIHMVEIERNGGAAWLTKLRCTGLESTLITCDNENWGSYSCSEKYAGVTCHSKTRLVDGINSCSGRVEVLHNGTWGTVCDDGWDLSDAAVVCREVGCGDAVEAKTGSYFGGGSEQTWLYDVNCFGNESTLNTCRTSSDPNPETLASEHASAGVICQSLVRLVNGINSCSGRVEVLHNGTWGTVCDDNWGILDGEVVCRELGCGQLDLVTIGNQFGETSAQIWMDGVECVGLEPFLGTCVFEGWGEYFCGSSEHAGVVCGYPVRLVDGFSPCSGRVEVLYNGEWGTVCDNGWDLSDAAVVCKELGCGDAIAAMSNAYFGRGTGPIWLRGVHCTGSESSLITCNSMGWRPNSCGHPQDAGVVCRDNFFKHYEDSATLQHGGRVLLRIEVKTGPALNPNIAAIKKALLEEMRNKIQTNETLSLRWKTQLDGNVFQKVVQEKKVVKTCD